MKAITGVSLAFILHASFYAPTFVSAAPSQPFTQEHANSPTAAIWQSTQAEHAYGFPEIKHNKKGTLTLNANALTFTAKSGSASVSRRSVTAVSAGNQRVEIWGIPGKLLRMTIPMVAAAQQLPSCITAWTSLRLSSTITREASALRSSSCLQTRQNMLFRTSR
jgi:hypothetical protein